MASSVRGRFAPSTSGPPHAGTALSALLVWCDATCRGGTAMLRLEDLDPDRSRPAHAARLVATLRWLGLRWDATVAQHQHAAAHAAALDALAAMGRLYACSCGRAQRRPDAPYPNRCRAHRVGAAWREAAGALRARLPAGPAPVRELGLPAAPTDPSTTTGDPIVRRRDGAVAYMLAGVVDDAAAGITDLVRGRDLAGVSAPQAALRQILGLPQPQVRHHLVLRHPDGRKLAKSAGDAPWPAPPADTGARAAGEDAALVVGHLAFLAGLRRTPAALSAAALAADFAWSAVRPTDLSVVLRSGVPWPG